MKKEFLSLGKVLSREMQQKISGGDVHCVTEDPRTKTSTIKEGPCDPNDLLSHEIDY
ncbi:MULTISPECIES: hypothetical protein [unclassified Tenacibaculum]|uniref:hypothetical protein n=1 Tax=unclassified Tenacibaculum TaxID=2635139 RepID=UPI001F27F710|nr:MULTISPECIES: hypothetical protein [unclassified Tenacibaculum]MCF2876495.1 hypothetical protein [Tenacibaculum sp. Cn5-1]MCF2936598.1 hypothetical protein [Tenacibaculum sp. Cn5-34]MCG7511809.1 hypothetical protein [Tenacibaculum sp. Cn5-46]